MLRLVASLPGSKSNCTLYRSYGNLLRQVRLNKQASGGPNLQMADGVWAFMDIEGIKPTNNAAERALRQSVIQRKISHGVQSRQGAICRSRLLTVTTTLRQQVRDVWQFLEQAWIAHHRGGVMPSLLPDP